MLLPPDDAPSAETGGSTSAPRLHGRDIVCVGFAEWEAELWTNQQHLMSRLARENRVLFVESLGLRRPRLAGRDLRRMAKRLVRGLAPPRERDGVQVLAPLVIPLHGNRAVRWCNRRLLRALVRRAVRRLGMREVILWAYVPQAEALLDALEPALVVYHCVDDIAAQKGVHAESFRAAETRFAGRADLVLASAPELARRMRLLAPQATVLEAPNVADTELFATALGDGPIDAALAALKPPRIVFTGAVVATKLDIELLLALARARPAWSIALVGPVGLGDPTTDVSRLAAEPNVALLGARPYRALPDVLRGADATIIPYARNELTGSVFPMKVYEYLAAGLPVVATPLPALADVADVHTASDGEAMASVLDELLAEDSPERRRARSQRAAGHSWDTRLAEIAGALPAGGPRRDLLVATHTPVLGTGQALRTYTLARALAGAGNGLDLLYARFGAPQPDRAFRAIPGIALHEVSASRGARRLLAYAGARLAGVPPNFARGISPELAGAAARLAGEPGRGRVIADGPIAAATLRGLARRRPVVYNAHNLESAFRHELDERGMGSKRSLRAFERGLLRRAAECWMVSDLDAAGARELCPDARIRYVPNVVDVEGVKAADGGQGEPCILMVADFSYEPNRNALEFLLGEAMPLVWRELPETRLMLVGRGLEDPRPEDPRVRALGFVEDLDEAYAAASCVAVPLLQGSGTPFKFIEALAHGVPVVATPRAAAGLAVRSGEHYRAAADAPAFAQALLELLRDGDEGLGLRGRELARERYSIEALTELVAP